MIRLVTCSVTMLHILTCHTSTTLAFLALSKKFDIPHIIQIRQCHVSHFLIFTVIGIIDYPAYISSLFLLLLSESSPQADDG